MSTTELAILQYCAQKVADCALVAHYTNNDWHEERLRDALVKFDKARADLDADPGTLSPHGDDA